MNTPRGVLASVAVAGIALLLTAGCGFTGVRGSGVVKTERRDVAGFTEVWIAGSGDADIRQGEADSLTVEAEENLLPLLESRLDGKRLTLGTRPDVNLSPTRPILYHLTVKQLTAVGISGSGSIVAEGIDTPRLSASISGSGSARFEGRASELKLDISGSGSFDAAALRSAAVRVDISGSGSATVNAAATLSAHVSGSGSVQYLGAAPQIDTHVSGSGSVTRAKE